MGVVLQCRRICLASANGFHAFNSTELFDESCEALRVVYEDGQYAREEAIVGVDVDATQHDMLFFRDNGGDIVDNA